jgi:hypothetical protein
MRYLITLLLFVCSNVFALDILIYHNNYAYTDSKSGLEGQGHTVSGSTSTTTDSASTLANYDVVFDQLYNNNCGSTCRGNYDTYVKDGGTLVIVGENSYFPTRNSNIESLIENKFGGTLDLTSSNVYGGEYYSGGTNNTVNTSISGADDGGQYIAGSEIATTSDGTWVAKTSSGAIIWMMWRGSSLPSGYTGSVIVTFDINQFQANYDSDATWEFFDDVIYYGINGEMQSSSPTTSTTTGTSGGITSAQSSSKSSARTRSNNQSDNTVYIDQVGDNNTVTIEQDGTATNTIRGIYSSGDDAGLIQGDSNTIEIRQGADTSTSSNLIEFKIIGNSNDVLLYQDRLNTGYEDTQAGGGHNIILDLNGSSNDIDIIQRNNYDTYGGHFVDLEVVGSSNGVNLKQISDYSKDIFGKVTGSNNSVTVYQHEDSNKYLDFDLTGNGHTLDVEQSGTGAHNAEITLINGTAPSTVNLLQQGSTDQSYSLEQTCYTTGGCTVDITQGN